jgi:hypothetical protein
VLEATVDRRLQEWRVRQVVTPQDEPLGHDPVGRVMHPVSVPMAAHGASAASSSIKSERVAIWIE